MKLNLHIFKDELLPLIFESSFYDTVDIVRCNYALIYDDTTSNIDESAIYITTSDNLPVIESDSIPLNIICVGTPPTKYLKKCINILYLDYNFQIDILLNKVLTIFHKYNEWLQSMQDILDNNLPLRQLGEVSINIVNNPIYVQGTSFQSIFQILSPCIENSTDIYKKYIKDNKMEDGVYLSMEDINYIVIDEEYNNAINSKKPRIYSGLLYGFRTLYYNISINETPFARICFDEIIRPFMNKDFVTIKTLGDFVKKGFKDKDIFNYNRPKDLTKILSSLLSHKLVEENKILSILHQYNWNINDNYFCIVMFQKTRNNSEDLLNPLALQISRFLTSDCYAIFENKIIFIFNITYVKKTRDDIINNILPILRDNLLFAGISTTYNDFKDLYYYYNQAITAYKIGQQLVPSNWYYRFENYNLEFLIRQCTAKQIPSALIPDGLKKLIAYDKRKHTEYTKLLKIYLENDRNIADTIKVCFIHRNTFLYRLERIIQISALNLDDYNTRLHLMISYKVLELKK